MKIKLTTMHYILIIFIIFSGIILYSYKINNDNFFREFLDCEFIDSNESYEEKLSFVYNKDGMIGFVREEIVYSDDVKNTEEIKEQYNKLKTKYNEHNIKCDYELNEDGNKIVITTRINVETDSRLFDSYFKDKKITHEMNANSIKNTLKDTFKCNKRTEA